MIVLDASAVVEFLLGTDAGRAVAARLSHVEETIHAPHLLDVEVAQVIRRLVLSKELGDQRASEALLALADLDLTRYPHDVLLPRIWELHKNLSAHDATYVALAEALGAVLVTADVRLSKASGHSAKIEAVRR